MQSQNSENHAEKHQEEKLSAPPGFASFTTFILKREEDTDDPSTLMATESLFDLEISSVPTSLDLDDTASIKKSLKYEHRPWIIHGQFPSEEESDSRQHDMSLCSNGCLPKGVVRGCAECSDCQKVSARCDRDGACSYVFEEAPVFHPREEEFKDILKYIGSISKQVEPYGFCRIVPPPSWQSPRSLEKDDIWQSYKFPTQIQRVNEPENHCLCEKESVVHETRHTKRRKLDSEFGYGCAANFISNEGHAEEICQSASGSQFTLIGFKRYADCFQKHYFSRDADMSDLKVSPVMNQKRWEPSELNIEAEYWRIFEKPTEEIEVLSATNLDCRSFNNGFPLAANQDHKTDFVENHTSGCNLSYVSKLPGSLLSFDTLDSLSPFAPRLHVGMCFSSLPWTVEEHCLYKLYYLHLGAPKIWYGTSGRDSYKFGGFQRQPFLNSPRGHPELLSNLVRQLSPGALKSEDIPVHRCIQRPREFVLFLPGAYHSGFDCGFNFSESAVFATLDWLPHGLTSIELYREHRMKTSISLDRMLLRAANEAVKAQWEYVFKGGKTTKIMTWKDASGKDGILAKTLRMRIRSEARCREYLSSAPQSRKMDKSFDEGDQKQECSTCCYDLFLSAASCPCNPSRFSCLKHTKHLCSCPWSDKTFIYRYLISELEILAEAVEGKLSAIRRWVKDDLGYVLYQHMPIQDPSSVAEGSNGRTGSLEEKKDPSSVEEKKASAFELLAGTSTGNPLGNVHEAATLNNSSDDTSLSSSSDLDIETCIMHLKALKRGKLPPCGDNEGESDSKPTRKSDTQLNNGGISVSRPSTCQADNIICLTDDD